jgi:hypothetical protein
MRKKMNEVLEYIKIHIISLQQDLESIDYVNEHHFYLVKQAEIATAQHILSVAQDILKDYE